MGYTTKEEFVRDSIRFSASAATRICQYESLKDERCLKIAKTFLLSKLEGQDKLLRKYGLRRFDYAFFEKIRSLENTDVHVAKNKLTTLKDCVLASILNKYSDYSIRQ